MFDSGFAEAERQREEADAWLGRPENRRCCPMCGSEQVSANVTGYLVDRMEDFPPPYPMICERCGNEWDDDA